MKISLTFFLLSVILVRVSGQAFVNGTSAREKHFIYEVKQIDEFFERFNNDSNAYIRKVYNVYHVKFKVDRSALIKSLFNYETQAWDSTLINNFTETVTNPDKPVRLDFYHGDWFAEANCIFQYNSSTIKIPIVLRITTNKDGGAKWVIAAIKSDALKPEETVTAIAERKNKNKFINPESHANNFIELHRVFKDKENLADYLDEKFFERNNSANFYSALMKNKLSFITVRNIRYHYLQINNWVFTVDYFSRETSNSGWLINSMKKITEEEKQLYIKKLLEE